MRASCRNGHDRRPMDYDYATMAFRCSCGTALTPERIRDATPPGYRPSESPLGRVLQALADYEIEAVYDGDRLGIEYPRPSLENQ